MAENFALPLGASAGHDRTDLDDVPRTDTPTDAGREAPVQVDV
jgi:hypothetical protein